MKIIISLLLISILLTSGTIVDERATAFNRIAEQYVKLGLTIGQYDSDFVDAYFGPDSLQPANKVSNKIPTDSLLQAVSSFQVQVSRFFNNEDPSLKIRAKWLNNQLTAFSRRIKIASGEISSFDKESKELFGVVAPIFPMAHFDSVISAIETLLPGKQPLAERISALTKDFVIPKEKLDTVFKVAIAEARKRTLSHYDLPKEESFTIEYVTNKPWGGYNWYKGNYHSVIQVNTDLPILIERAIDLACHEGYPGHHVYNALLEQKLYKEKGWTEVSLYPLFSPQSLIAEGSANYGIEVAFPGEEKIGFAKKVLMPLAGIKPDKADVYFKLLELMSHLSYARNEDARQYVDGKLSEKEAKKLLRKYSLYSKDAAEKQLSFIKKYRSYVINYNYGQQIIMEYIERNGGSASNPAKRWELFKWLLSNPVNPQDLL